MYIKLACRFIKKNIKMSVFICIALIIAGSLFISGGTFINAYSKLCISNAEQTYGSWHLKLKSDCMEDMEAYLSSKGDDIEEVGTEEYLYSTGYTSYGEEYFLDIVACDSERFDLSNVNVYKGRLPENENEIVIDYSYYADDTEMVYDVYNLGEEITLDVGKRMSDGEEVYGDVYGGELEETETVTYTIVGFFDSGKIAEYGIAAYTYSEEIDDADKYWIRVSDENENEKTDAIISDCGLSEDDVFNSETNGDYLLEDECAAAVNGTLYTYISDNGYTGANSLVEQGLYIIAIIIFVAGFLMVTNIYQLVLSSREHDYATLMALGMSKNGIQLISLIEGIILWFASTVVSILLSLLLDMGLSVMVNDAVFHNIRNIDLHFSVISAVTGAALVFGMMIISVFFSFISGKNKSVQQMLGGSRYSGNRKISKAPWVELRLSLTYISKNKMKFIFMVLSFATSIILIYGLYCEERELQVSELVDGYAQSADFYAYGTDVWNIDELKEEIPYAESVGVIYTSGLLIENTDLPYTDEIKNDEEYEEVLSTGELYINVTFFSEEEYNRSLRAKLTEDMTYDEWLSSGEVVLSDWYKDENGEMKEAFGNDGNTVIEYEASDELITSYEAGSITCTSRTKMPDADSMNYIYGVLDIYIYMPLERLSEYFDDSSYQFLNIDAEDGHEYDLLEWLTANKDIYNYTLQDNITEKVGEENKRVIILSCLIFVVGLLAIVCIINIGNTVKSNIYSRRYELGILEELGMSNMQKFFVCMPDIFIALILAFLLSGVIIKILISGYFTKAPGIPVWLSLGTLAIYFVIILAVNIPAIKKLNMIKIREGQ